MTENLSLFLARRQKRLKYWQELFATGGLPTEAAQRFEVLFEKYKMLIAKAVKAADEQARDEACSELRVIDRELTQLFEDRRLLTSALGVAAVTDYSARGSGGAARRGR